VNVLVDSNVWSEALRRDQSLVSSEVQVLRDLILEDRVQLIGALRQEILSGIRESERFARFKEKLRAFPDHEIEPERYEEAAAFFNQCRTQGIQGSHTDFLLCACAVAWNQPILTKDQDFRRYQALIPIQLLLDSTS
jgi:predicted nucleic acid-binding protein